MKTFCKESSRFGWRIVFFSGIPHPHLLGEPLPESPFFFRPIQARNNLKLIPFRLKLSCSTHVLVGEVCV